MIRKQQTEEEEQLARKNIAIVEIKHNENKTRETQKKVIKNKIDQYEIKNRETRNNETIDNENDINRKKEITKHEKGNKSKSLSKLNNDEKQNNNNKKYIHNDNNKRSLSNYNHNFVNINLCKDKQKNSSIYYKLRGINNREKCCSTFRKDIKGNRIVDNLELNLKQQSFDDLIPIKTANKYSEIIPSKLNKTFCQINTDLINFNRVNHVMITSYSLKGKRKKSEEDINIISDINDDREKKNNTIVNSKRDNCIKTEENINIYIKQKKEYQNGVYEGIMLNDKREIKGIMFYSNGAKYDGQWRNDKKNGKGIFTSSHYYNCKNKVGMKYEGDFKDDKFDGYGITTYTNGDKYEGEWKNNKQYGKGTVSYLDGSKYDGEWVNGHFEGLGVFYLKNGEKYEGRFFDNKYNGYGKYYYNNGNYLEGIFKNDHPRGQCILHKTDGTMVNVLH